MKLIPLRKRVATIAHGHDEAHHEITESCAGGLAALTTRLADAGLAASSPETT